MSVEVNKIQNYANNNYAEQLKQKQSLNNAERAAAKKETHNVEVSEKKSIPQDEYISSKKSGTKPNGLYRIEKDEHGNQKVFFEDPKKSGSADEREQSKVNEEHMAENVNQRQPKVSADHVGTPAEKCTANTDSVDSEIKRLKEKKQQLEQQIQSASQDPKKVKELEKKLEQVESELSKKDNDTYRRQHTSFY